MKTTLNQEVAAALAGKSSRWLRYERAAGRLPSFEAREFGAWLRAQWDREATRIDYEQERARLTKAQADKAAAEAADLRREMAPAAELQARWQHIRSALLAELQAHLPAAAGRAARECRTDAEAAEALAEFVADALHRAADGF